MPSPLRALSIIAAYAATVGGVAVALVATADSDATPWLALLAAMAVLHLGFGLIVARFWVALLPLVVCVVAWLLDLGDFSITTLMVGIPCAMLMVAGASLRIGWDGGPAAAPVAQIRRERKRTAAAVEDPDWDPVQPLWDDAVA
ncbi:hypothetical protein DSM104299_02523 [Baekduia alba]|uniref:hypothetical protein n=1 Tax=Baekduia alba TaxID=2997333 RepID=UPI00233FED18|nr:hypothetical protein [Baekduia alba]WCB93806.1 hypothetical protein DSM104299_02523 [Baekduia alba]